MLGLSTIIQPLKFVVGLTFMFWSIALAGISMRLPFLSRRGRNDMFDWGKILLDLFHTKIQKCGTGDLYRGPKCVYLCNHRSWCDFFLDVVATDGRACVLTRGMVVAVFFVSCPFAWIGNYVLVFNRNAVKNIEKFNNWLDERMCEGPLEGMLVYPEGHRNIRSESLPLRRGILKYTYSRRIPVQIIISSNKESVICEKKLSVNFGSMISVGYSDVIDTSMFENFEAFYAAIEVAWNQKWKEVYSAEQSDMTPFKFERRNTYLLSQRKYLTMIIWMFGAILLLLWTLSSSYLVGRRILRGLFE